MEAGTYNSREWFAFRHKIINARNYTCEECHGSPPRARIFQIHHLIYKQNAMLWQYADDEVMLVCKGCHAKLHGKILPTSGWQIDYEDDLGSPEGECDYCGREIRYAFQISHTQWPSMIVGSGCCDRLTESSEGSDRQAFFERLARFSNPKNWTNEVHQSFRHHKGFGVFVLNQDDNWRLIISNRIGTMPYKSREEAVKAAFEKIETQLAKDGPRPSPG